MEASQKFEDVEVNIKPQLKSSMTALKIFMQPLKNESNLIIPC